MTALARRPARRERTARHLVARFGSVVRWRRCAALVMSFPRSPDLESEQALEDAAMSLWYSPHRLPREPGRR